LFVVAGAGDLHEGFEEGYHWSFGHFGSIFEIGL
jgi:hypothetical protein